MRGFLAINRCPDSAPENVYFLKIVKGECCSHKVLSECAGAEYDERINKNRCCRRVHNDVDTFYDPS